MKKRVFSLILAISIILSMTVAASASVSSDTVTGVTQPITYNKSYDFTSVRPGATMLFPLTADMFTWSSGQVKGKEAVTIGQLRNIAADYTYPSSSRSKDVIEKVSLVTETVDGLKTICVKLEFKKPYVGVDSKDFDVTLFLRRSNARMQFSDVKLSGTFANSEIEINSARGYIDISNGTVLKPTEYIRSIEIGIGEGVIISSKLFADKKYYGVAENGVTSSDEAMVRKYPSILDIYTLNTVNLKASGNIVMIEGYGRDAYIYNMNGKYLGTTGTWVEYSDKYFVTDTKVDMGGGVVSSTASSSSQVSADSKSSSSTGTAATGTTVTVDSITKLTQSAVSAAKSSGSKVAIVRVKDAKSISTEAVSAMVKTATASGMTTRLDADTMNGSAVSGRLTMRPTSSTKLSSDITPGVYVSSNTVTNVKAKFNKWFGNSFEVISLGHKGSFGMNVTIAARIKFTSLDTTKLYFYAYNAEKNQYQQIKSPNYSVDKNGYLHFTTSVGGEIIVSQGALAVR